MRKAIYVLFTSIFLFAACKSKEEKAAELIRNELSKTLYDFDSYQPIETSVIEAKMNAFNDSSCWKKGAVLAYGMQKLLKYMDMYKDAKEHMEIWGKPTYYSSSYSDNRYYKYRDECRPRRCGSQRHYPHRQNLANRVFNKNIDTYHNIVKQSSLY